MKNKIFLTCILFLAALPAFAQETPTFRLQVSSDTVLLGNYLIASFKLENGEARKFEAPVFEGFDILSGPNYSSNFSMINGEVSQSMSYVYHLKPQDIGIYYIQPASVEVADGNVLETPPLDILVLPNPDQIIQAPQLPGQPDMDGWFRQNPWFQDIPPQPEKPQPTKKKKKIIRL